MPHLERYFSQQEQKGTPLLDFANDGERRTGDRTQHPAPTTTEARGSMSDNNESRNNTGTSHQYESGLAYSHRSETESHIKYQEESLNVRRWDTELGTRGEL